MTRFDSLTTFPTLFLLFGLLSTPVNAIPVCDGVCDGQDDCPDDCAYCGDGFCNGGETSSWCPSDCPPPTCTTDTCSTCSRPSIGADAEGDSIPDQLEYDLAHAFFPAVMLQDVESDLQQAYLYRGKAIPYTVRVVPASGICNEAYKCLEIRYGLAYVRDYGDRGMTAHLGDSEFYALIVSRTQSWPVAQANPGYWQMIRDFTAAHWGASADSSVYGAYGSCPDAYAGYCDGIPDPSSGERSCYRMTNYEWCYSSGCTWRFSCQVPPRCYSSYPASSYVSLYAAEGKHSTYHTDGECDAGGFDYFGVGSGEDECPNTNLHSLRSFKGELLQNVGNGFVLPPDTTIQHPNMCDLYDVWSGQKFGSPDSTSYYQHFTTALAWCLAY
jgi:hypothetical protein